VPLTAIQKEFFESNYKNVHYYNQALLLEVKEELDSELLGKAFLELLSHHDALRMRYRRVGKSWKQRNLLHEDKQIYEVLELSNRSKEELREEIEQRLLKSMQINHYKIVLALLV